MLTFLLGLMVWDSLSAQGPEGRDFLRQLKAKEVQWGPEACEGQALVRPKGSKRWGLFVIHHYEGRLERVDTLAPAEYDSLGFFCGMERFVLVKKTANMVCFCCPRRCTMPRNA